MAWWGAEPAEWLGENSLRQPFGSWRPIGAVSFNFAMAWTAFDLRQSLNITLQRVCFWGGTVNGMR